MAIRKQILGYKQDIACKLGLSLDELLILRHFEDFIMSGKMEKIIIDGDVYYWVYYKYFVENLPIIGMKKERLAEVMLYNLCSKPIGYDDKVSKMSIQSQKKVSSRKFLGLLKMNNRKSNEGSKSYFTFTQKYYDLKEDICTPSSEHSTHSNEGFRTHSNEGADKSIKDKSIKDNKKENIKEKNKLDILINNYTSNLALRETILDFINMRKEIKAKMTHRAIELMLNKLDKLSKEDDEKIEILNQSIVNGWKGIFEIKGSVSNGSSSKKINGKSEKFKDYDFSFRNDTEGCEPTGEINF